ncbi:MAG: hypothetical protein ACYDDD_09950 [Acidithiobacillus ferrivorans]
MKLFAMMALAIFGPLVVFGGGIAIFMEQARIRATLRLIRWLFTSYRMDYWYWSNFHQPDRENS